MDTTLASKGATRPEPVERSKGGAGHIDPMIAEFDAYFEALTALDNDAEAFEKTIADLEHIRACTRRMEEHARLRMRAIVPAVAEIKTLAIAADQRLSRRVFRPRTAR
jgi:hypothetical protein